MGVGEFTVALGVRAALGADGNHLLPAYLVQHFDVVADVVVELVSGG